MLTNRCKPACSYPVLLLLLFLFISCSHQLSGPPKREMELIHALMQKGYCDTVTTTTMSLLDKNEGRYYYVFMLHTRKAFDSNAINDLNIQIMDSIVNNVLLGDVTQYGATIILYKDTKADSVFFTRLYKCETYLKTPNDQPTPFINRNTIY